MAYTLLQQQTGLVRSDPHGRRSDPHLEWGLASEALEHDGADAPEVRFGIVVLGHDDLRSLGSTQQQARPFTMCLLFRWVRYNVRSTTI